MGRATASALAVRG